MSTNNEHNSQTTSGVQTPTITDVDDPRYSVAMLVGALRPLIQSAEGADLDQPTPCDDFSIRDLLDHHVMVLRRLAAIGRGEHFTKVMPEAYEANWAQLFTEQAHQVRMAWDDPARLSALVSVPWGEVPGAAALWSYAAELTVHGWDLATALGEPFVIDGGLHDNVEKAAFFIPEEGRASGEIPFAPVVAAPDDATSIERMAAWMGRTITRP